MSAPSFPWLPLKPMPSYSSPAMRSFYEGSALMAFNFAVQHPLSNIFLRIFLFWLFYLGPMLTLPFLMLLLALPFEAKLSDFSAPKQFLLLVAGASFTGMALPSHFLAALRCAGYCPGLRVCSVDDEIYPALFIRQNPWAWELPGQIVVICAP